MAIDFHYYLINKSAGQEKASLLRALVAKPTHGAHRHRKEDMLAILVSFPDNIAIVEEIIDQQLEKLSGLFFKAAGSVTRAIQVVAEEINNYLLDRNIELADSNLQTTAILNISVLHKGYLFIGQGGNASTFVIKNEGVEMFQGGDDIQKMLGTTRRILVKYHQVQIEPGDVVVMSPKLPDNWKENLFADATQIDFAEVYQRLEDSAGEVQALIIKCREGKGNVIKYDPFSTADQISGGEQSTEDLDPTFGTESNQEVDSEERLILKPELEHFAAGSDDSVPADASISIDSQEEISIKPGITEEKPKNFDDHPIAKKEKRQSRLLFSLAAAWQKMRIWRDKSTQKAAQDIDIKQQATIQNKKISPTIMYGLTIALPAVLITISLLIYINSGRREQLAKYLEQAKENVAFAAETEDIAEQRDYWQQANFLANAALQYGNSDEAEALVKQTQFYLDELDLTARLDFRPALTDFFPEGSEITKIRSTNSSVYLLEKNSGTIQRLFLNTKGFYETDQEFNCGPGEYALLNMDAIRDFLVLPVNSRDYEILGIDEKGTLLYCKPGGDSIATSLIPPTEEWGKIAGIALDEYRLFVLDAEKDAIWLYTGRDFEVSEMAGVVFDKQPDEYLASGTIDLGGTLDIGASQDDVYILHQDSHMTICQYNPYRENPTECQDPVLYSDNRVGLEKNPLVYMDSRFIGMQDLRYPNGSIYILDSVSSTIMRFSFQLNLERTYKPQPNRTYPLPDIYPTGFGITTEQKIFLAFQNQLFISELP